MSSTKWTRRQVLKGAGVALSVPWLETFETKRAQAQTASLRRYVSFYWPLGTADGYLWGATGAGASMTLAPILQPLQPNIAKIMPLGGVGDYSPWGGHVEPSHSNNCATSWTGVKANGPMNAYSSISIDQAIANQIVASNRGKSPTPLASLQVGLSTLDSYTDGLPAPHSRSISWQDAESPLYKIISPQTVFDALVAGGLAQTGNIPQTMLPDPTAIRRQQLQRSVLDYITDSATSLQMRLSKSDGTRLRQFLTSVRDLEQRVTATPFGGTGLNCSPPMRPSQTAVVNQPYPPGFDRGMHATLMIDLIVMAFQCDLTRVISFMLDDARSDFVYDFLTMRTFSMTGSKPSMGAVAGYNGLNQGGDQNDGFATITWWMMAQLNDLITKISVINEGAGTAFDNTIIYAGSGLHGGNCDGLNVPVVVAGTGGSVFKTGQAYHLGTGAAVATGNKNESGENLQDVHLTILNTVFGAALKEFGVSVGNYKSQGVLTELLA
jgi:hypothetical protein